MRKEKHELNSKRRSLWGSRVERNSIQTKQILKESQYSPEKSKWRTNFPPHPLFTFQPWGSAPSGLSKNKESCLSKQQLNLKANSSAPCASAATLLSISPSLHDWPSNARLGAVRSAAPSGQGGFSKGHSKTALAIFVAFSETQKSYEFIWLTVSATQLQLIFKPPFCK
jgi:hypothetical protein